MGPTTSREAVAYPNLKFIGVDQLQDTSKPVPINLVGLNFPEDQAGFLVGALAGQMTRSGKIGAVCGTDIIPNSWRYGEGYKAGAAYIDPAIEVTVVYHNTVEINEAFSDPEWGAASASSMIGKGVDVVFGAGGQTGQGAVRAAALKGVLAIGADSDQYQALPEARKMLLSSALKFITPGVFDLIKLARDDKFPSGNYSGTVGYAPFHDLLSQVPAKVKVRMKEIAAGLVDGTIKTNVSPAKP
jgi:basic membrane protein A